MRCIYVMKRVWDDVIEFNVPSGSPEPKTIVLGSLIANISDKEFSFHLNGRQFRQEGQIERAMKRSGTLSVQYGDREYYNLYGDGLEELTKHPRLRFEGVRGWEFITIWYIAGCAPSLEAFLKQGIIYRHDGKAALSAHRKRLEGGEREGFGIFKLIE